MLYDAGDLLHSVGTTFKTVNGATVTRLESTYLHVAAAQNQTNNFLSLSTDATARRIALKGQIAARTDALRNATTDAEVQKLSGVLTGLSSALKNTDYESHQAEPPPPSCRTLPIAPVISGRQGCHRFGFWAFAKQTAALSVKPGLRRVGASRVPYTCVLAHH